MFFQLYTALSSLTEPHQLSASLVCVAYACPSIITEVEKFPGGRLKLLQLIPQLLPALDANDNLKLASATMLLSSIFLQTPLANCAQAGIHHPNLTEVSKRFFDLTVPEMILGPESMGHWVDPYKI